MEQLSSDEENSENNDVFPQKISQKSNMKDFNDNYNYSSDIKILRDFLLNPSLEHRNLNKVLDFGINKKNYGPYEIGFQFNAKFFMNIIKNYYLNLNCERINFIVYNKIIYFYSHVDSSLKIYTILNTRYIGLDKVKIIEVNGNDIRVNFPLLQLLKNLELHNFTNNETIKIFFKKFKNKKKAKNEKEISIEENNPFYDLQLETHKFEKEFNFENEAIPGLLIAETVRDFNFTMDCNFAPDELTHPPNIPESIFSNYIINISIDKLSNFAKRMNLTSPVEISCNKYICNFVTNSNCENFFMFNKSEGAEINQDNFVNYFKHFDRMIENGELFKKMITFTLTQTEFEALKILNKKTALIYFYADKKEKYYFTQEFDQDSNRASSVILQSTNGKPIIKDIVECCLYSDHWEEWIKYLSEILSRDGINELKNLRELHEKNYLVSNNKKNKKKKNKNEEVKNENDENNENSNGNKIRNNKESSNNRISKNYSKIMNKRKSVKNINIVDGKNEFEGISLFSNDRRGNASTLIMKENKRESICEIGRGKVNLNKNKDEENKHNKEENLVNPFNF